MIRETINQALKAAMLAKSADVGTLRMITAAMKQKDIDVARPRGDTAISDDEVLGLLQGLIKSRRESATLYAEGGRQDLADKETHEITLIETFLPQQLSEPALQAAIKALISETGAAGIKDMGKVMALLKSRYAGQTDMTKASAAVRGLLGAGA